MKAFLILLCGLSLAVAGYAQAPAAVDDQGAAQPFTSDELDQMLGPIALYPDPLIGLILPASTVPSDIVLADRYVEQNGDPAQIPNQTWDDSVKGLTHYPDLLKWLDQNLAWTTQLGQAFATQPGDVMNSIQQLRARARADGTLVNSDQQQVVTDDGEIAIAPTNPDQISVPQYDPDAVYDDDYSIDEGPVITYGTVCAGGPWLDYWPDWWNQVFYRGDWRRWRSYRGHASFAGDAGLRAWSPNPNRAQAQHQYRGAYSAQGRVAIVHPQILPGVKLVPARHPGAAAHPLYVTPPAADFTGRGAVPPRRAVVSSPAVVAPPVQVVPRENVVTEYGRGSDARAASERGEFSRQAPVYQAPAASYGRPAAPVYQGGYGAGASAGAGAGRGGSGAGGGQGQGQGRYGH